MAEVKHTMTMSGPTSEALRTHFNDLIVAIQEPVGLACALYSKYVVSRGVKDEVGMIALSPVQKKNILLTAVQSKLETEPDQFNVFVNVLKRDGMLTAVAEKLEKTRAELHTQHTASI